MRSILLFILTACYLPGFAQFVFDVDLKTGVSKPIIFHPFEKDMSATLNPSFALSSTATAKVKGFLSLGLTLQYQRFVIAQSWKDQGHIYATGFVLRNKSNYICLSPTVDFRLSKTGVFHLYTAAPIAFLTNGRQQTQDIYQQAPNYQETYVYHDESANINKRYYGLTFGMRQLVPLIRHRWFAVFDESYTFLLSDITGYGTHPQLRRHTARFNASVSIPNTD